MHRSSAAGGDGHQREEAGLELRALGVCGLFSCLLSAVVGTEPGLWAH